MDSNGGAPLLDGGQCALVAAEERDAIGKLCIDFMQRDDAGATAAVAVTGGQDPATLLDRWQRTGGRFRDVALLAFGDDTRATATTEVSSGLGLVQPLDDSIAVDGLLDRIERRLGELAGGGGRLAVYVAPLGDRFDSGAYLELAEGLDRVLSTHGAVGVVHVRPDLRSIPAIRSRFHSVVELGSVGENPPRADDSLPAPKLFEALSSGVRLRVLDFLHRGADGPTDVGTLAASVAGSDGDTSEAAVHRRHVGLVHRDLPALADLGLLRYDADGAIVEPTDRMARVEPFLTLARGAPTRED